MPKRTDAHLPEDLLPDLSGDEALLLAALLQRIADAIWRTYGPDMGLALARKAGALKDLDLPRDDDDLPF